MSYYFNNSGHLAVSNAYRAPSGSRTSSFTQGSIQRAPVTDSIRPTSLYVESQHKLTNGHLAQWSGSAAMFKKDGAKIDDFDSTNGHEFALSSVEHCDEHGSKKVAGVVIDHAANPESVQFVHKGVHSQHLISENQHIHRLATSGSVVLAWVLADLHENRLDGIYTEYLNGAEVGLCICRGLGADHFTIERVADSNQVTQLRTDLDTLAEQFAELTGH